MDHRLRVPLTADEHAALERLAATHRRSMGQQAAVMLAPLLAGDDLGPWEVYPRGMPGECLRRASDGTLRAAVWKGPHGWLWKTVSADGSPKREVETFCPTHEVAMGEADAALGVAP